MASKPLYTAYVYIAGQSPIGSPIEYVVRITDAKSLLEKHGAERIEVWDSRSGTHKRTYRAA